MKAITYTQYGSPEVLKLSEMEKPTPADNQILIKMMATTVNSGDARLRRADPFLVRLMFGLFSPKIKGLGNVISGIVESVGKDVTNFKPGDEVFEESAAIVFGGHTALHFLKKSGIKKGDKVLIYGASGAVGSIAVQITKYYGAEVTAVTSTANLDLVKQLGADLVLD